MSARFRCCHTAPHTRQPNAQERHRQSPLASLAATPADQVGKQHQMSMAVTSLPLPVFIQNCFFVPVSVSARGRADAPVRLLPQSTGAQSVQIRSHARLAGEGGEGHTTHDTRPSYAWCSLAPIYVAQSTLARGRANRRLRHLSYVYAALDLTVRAAATFGGSTLSTAFD